MAREPHQQNLPWAAVLDSHRPSNSAERTGNGNDETARSTRRLVRYLEALLPQNLTPGEEELVDQWKNMH
jgi:hypothetical protein